MNQKTLGYLVGALVVLGALFFFVQSADAPGKHSAPRELMADVQMDRISRIKIQQGKDVAELELRDGIWVVPAKGGYPADYGKIRNLVVKILDLRVSQKITDSEANFENLGLTDKAVEAGKTKVDLLDKDGQPLVGVYLGELRKKKPEQGFAPPAGQYVRRTDRNDVYLIGETISAAASLVTWLDTALVNVMPAKIARIRQYSVSADASGGSVDTLDFEAQRTGDSGTAGQVKFGLIPPPAANEKVKDVIDSQVGSALENVVFSDVRRADDEPVKGVFFDKKTVVQLTNGLRYTAFSSEKGENGWVKLEVTFDEGFAKERAAVVSSELSSIASSASPASDAENSTAVSSAAQSSSVAAEPMSNADEAAKLAAKFQGWVFELRKYQLDKLRMTRDSLIEKPGSGTDSSSAPPSA